MQISFVIVTLILRTGYKVVTNLCSSSIPSIGKKAENISV